MNLLVGQDERSLETECLKMCKFETLRSQNHMSDLSNLKIIFLKSCSPLCSEE